MSALCCVLGPPEWFEALIGALDPAGPELRLVSSLDDPLLASGRADIVVVRSMDTTSPRVTRDLLRRLSQPRFGDPLRLVSTADADEIDRVVAFELGVDDFVADPVSFREIGLRVRALLRRQVRSPAPPVQRRWGRLELDHEARDIVVDGERAGLTLAEYRVVAELAVDPGVVVKREDLLFAARGPSSDAEPWVGLRSVDTHIKRIRRKIPLPDLIRTIRGVGYRLVPPSA